MTSWHEYHQYDLENGGMDDPPESASQTPPCRVCKSAKEVIVYPEDHSLTICPGCCDGAEHPDDGETGHVWLHDKWERDWVCIHCGIPRGCTEYAHDTYD